MAKKPKKLGRPRKPVAEKHQRVGTTFDPETIRKLTKLGKGDRYEGLRRAVKLALATRFNR